MKNRVASMLSGVLFTACVSVSAACVRPEAPVLPDPDTAVTPQMVKAQNEVKAYLAKAEKYLSCVKLTAQHDAMVVEMNVVADNFNGIVRAYKARMSDA